MLGQALEWENMVGVGLSMLFWEALRRITLHVILPRVASKLGRRRDDGEAAALGEKDSQTLSLALPSFVHAIIVSLVSLYILFVEPVPDSLYVQIPLAMKLYAFACGYFAWDIAVVLLVMPKFDFAFCFHAIACFFAYLFALHPFLNYYGACYLLFELSTPLMYVRQFLIILKQQQQQQRDGAWLDEWISRVEVAFALTFAFVRILLGFPMNAMVWYDLVSLLRDGLAQDGHPWFVPYFYLVANLGLALINLFWMRTMLTKRLGNGGNGKKQHVD